MIKSDELARLAGVVFEGAPDDVDAAAMYSDGAWVWFYPAKYVKGGVCFYQSHKEPELSKNQPVTDLPWQETLIKRSDYE